MTLKTILKNFLNHVDTLDAQRKLGNDLYEVDFQKLKQLTEQLKRDDEYLTSEGLKDVNRRKNRYKDILPYDGTRVVLSEYPGVPGSDFINANYIKGASGSLAYIASQGPLPNTLVDYWRMIWECEVQVIVMACNEQESGKYKCERYWPEDDEKKQYGNINVELVKWRQVCPDFLVRTLKACWENEERVLCQFHYTTWPDHGVPNSVQPILELVRLIRDCQASEAVPVLVHCSAGCGRTGTICAIDYVWGLMRMGKLTKSFNLFNVISDMRRQRIAMVQTKEQYVLVHKAIGSLFEQQLRVIDSHTYENLDEDGEPLVFKELLSEESLYEDILEPDIYGKSYKTPEKIVDGSLIKASRHRDLQDTHSLHRHADKLTNNFNNTIGIIPIERIMDLSLVTPQEFHKTPHPMFSDTENKEDVLNSSRNSSTLSKLRREESVKRLISGWNKVTQTHHHGDNMIHVDHHGKGTGKGEAPEEMSTKERNSNEQHSYENYSDHPFESSSDKSHSSSEEMCKLRLKENKETYHSGKLVGKATVIRRPSIAKLKALFEKSPNSNSERHHEEHSRRRRPLFRSHSHYVGYSRNSSAPDADDSSMEQMSVSATEEPMLRSPSPMTAVSSAQHSSSISYLQPHSTYYSHTMRKSPSPITVTSDGSSKHSSKRRDQNFNTSHTEHIQETTKTKYVDSEKKNHLAQTENVVPPFSSYESTPIKMEEAHRSPPAENNVQKVIPVHQRVKQYSSILVEKPPVLPLKKHRSSKETRHNKGPAPQARHAATNKVLPTKNENMTHANAVSPPVDGYKSFGNHAPTTYLEETKPKTLDFGEFPTATKGRKDNIAEKSHKVAVYKTLSADSRRKDGAHHAYVKPTTIESLYGHTGNRKSDASHSQKEGSYINVNTVSQRNIQQIEDKIKNHPRGAIIDLTTRKSYVENAQNNYEKPPAFVCSIQPVKLSQPMETYELKTADKMKEQTNSNYSTTASQTVTKSLSHHDDSKSKNLLLHSPPPKSKRNHSSKSSHHHHHSNREKSASNECLDDLKTDKTASRSSSETPSSNISSKHSDSDTVTKSSLSSHEPASRSDPRYFPVNRQTPEDAKYASEKQKALEMQKNINRESLYSTPKDLKPTYHYTSHQKSQYEMFDVTKILPKPYPPHTYHRFDTAKPWLPKESEPIYGKTPSSHHALHTSHDASLSNREHTSNSIYYGGSNNPQHSRNASAPASFGMSGRENLYGTVQHNMSVGSSSYLQGPPKPPRTFNHQFKYFNRDAAEDVNKEQKQMPEGGRYIVTVVSPKQAIDRMDASSTDKTSSDYQYYGNIPKRHIPERAQGCFNSANEQMLSRSYPLASCDRVMASKAHLSTSEGHMDHPAEAYGTGVKATNKYADYENIYGTQREYADAMSRPPPYSMSQGNQNIASIQYSQSDASIYGVQQNPVAVKTSNTWQYPCSVQFAQSDPDPVPKRVYFDTLQRRHKQVSWEQRRSHDDMDIRPPPSARLKEQIHARRSMVELDNLEISVMGDNGFLENDPLVHNLLPRNDYNHDIANRVEMAQKRPPVELSDSLLGKEVHQRKNQTHNRETFGGSLYKAFGKLTSFTKFNSKEANNKVVFDDSRESSKVVNLKEERPDPPPAIPQWTPSKPKDHSEPSEQWTEV